MKPTKYTTLHMIFFWNNQFPNSPANFHILSAFRSRTRSALSKYMIANTAKLEISLFSHFGKLLCGKVCFRGKKIILSKYQVCYKEFWQIMFPVTNSFALMLFGFPCCFIWDKAEVLGFPYIICFSVKKKLSSVSLLGFSVVAVASSMLCVWAMNDV